MTTLSLAAFSVLFLAMILVCTGACVAVW
jgi:hypothetical protein